MASAPRPGRKGGKIESPPVAPSAPARTPPTELEMPRETSELPEQPQASTTAFQFDSTSTFFQFDPTAVNLVGKGSVLGGTKQVRMEERSALAEKEAVEAKLRNFFENNALGSELVNQTTTNDVVTSLQSHDAIATTLDEGLRLVNDVVGSDGEAGTEGVLVLVVVPSYFVVEKTVAELHKTIKNVGALVGSRFNSDVDPKTRTWVTDAKSALGLFTTAGLTTTVSHLCFYKSHVHQPSVQLVLAAARQSEDFKGKYIFVGGSIVNDVPKLAQYLSPLTVDATQQLRSAEPHPTTQTMDLEEVCSLLDKPVLSVAVDRTGRFPGPHPKFVEHSLELSTLLLEKLFRLAKVPQTVVVYTADVTDASAHFQRSTYLRKFFVERDELSSVPANVCVVQPDDHRIHVFHHWDADVGSLFPTIILDKGTIRSSWLPSQAEVAFPARRTEWESVEEQNFRKRALNWSRSGGLYISLFPREAADVFPAATSLHLELVDMESALLLVSRAKAVVSPDKLLTSFPKESILRSMQELADAGAIVAPDNIGFTFSGEVLHRLPTLPETSNIVLGGLVVGLEEAAIAVAAVSTILVFPHKVDAQSSNEEWFNAVRTVRNEQTHGKAATSDVLADALIVLKWRRASLKAPDQAEALAAEIGVPLYRLTSIVNLMTHLREQLTDYAYLDSFNALEDVERIVTSLETSWDTLLIILATSLCRKSVIVRNDGQISARDTAGNMMFLRSAKTATPNAFAPSSVAWKVGNAVIGSAITNSASHLYVRDATTIRAGYYLTVLMLLAPSMEYSPPQATATGQVVYVSMAANGQQKRARVDIDGAARILEFRDKWNLVYGCILTLRSLPRNTTVSQFTQYLQSRDKSIQFKVLQRELQAELRQIAEEVTVIEDNKSFVKMTSHRLMPNAATLVDASLVVSKPSDEELLIKFSQRSWSSAAPAAAAVVHADVEMISAHRTPFIEDDDVETAQSYFAQHGPLIEEDDE